MQIQALLAELIDPFHLDFSACAMDWRAQSAGSREGHVSWLAGRAHSL